MQWAPAGEVWDEGKSEFAFICWRENGWWVDIAKWLEETDTGQTIQSNPESPRWEGSSRVNTDCRKSQPLLLPKSGQPEGGETGLEAIKIVSWGVMLNTRTRAEPAKESDIMLSQARLEELPIDWKSVGGSTENQFAVN